MSTQKKYTEKALAIASEIGVRNGEGTLYRELGTVFHSLGDYVNAKKYFEKALAIAIEIGDRRNEAYSRLTLGDVLLCQ